MREDTSRKYYPFLQKIARKSCHDAGTPSLSRGYSGFLGVTKTKLTNKYTDKTKTKTIENEMTKIAAVCKG